MTSRCSRVAVASVLGLLIILPGCHKATLAGAQDVQLTNTGPGGNCAQNGGTAWVAVTTATQSVTFTAPTPNTTFAIAFSGTCPFTSVTCPVTGTGSVNAGTIATGGDYPYSSIAIGPTPCPNIGGGNAGDPMGLRVRPGP